jgi:hypothetical protein
MGILQTSPVSYYTLNVHTPAYLLAPASLNCHIYLNKRHLFQKLIYIYKEPGKEKYIITGIFVG